MGSETEVNEEATPPEDLSPSVGYLVAVLGERIRAGSYPHGRWLPPERALSDEFAVSRPTVRSAIDELEKRRLVRRSARHRPIVWNETAAARNGNKIHPANAATGRRSIGLWISGDPSDHGPTAMARAILRTIPADDYRVVTACPNSSLAAEAIASEGQALRRMAEDDDCVGLILWYLGGNVNRGVLEEMRARRKPFVFVDRMPPEGFEADYVGIYNEYAAADAVRHLIARGHRSIGHITNPTGSSTVRERRAGYEAALQEAGLPLRPELIVVSDFESLDEAAVERYWREQVLGYFRSLPEPPTSVFTVNDYSAYRLIRALRAEGLRIPEDLAVVGFDDSERWSLAEPFMTSISQPFERIGIEAVKLLLSRLDAGPSSSGSTAYRHVLLPSPLVVRASSSTAYSGR